MEIAMSRSPPRAGAASVEQLSVLSRTCRQKPYGGAYRGEDAQQARKVGWANRTRRLGLGRISDRQAGKAAVRVNAKSPLRR